jgi:predicted secreted Zn-dependent protease
MLFIVYAILMSSCHPTMPFQNTSLIEWNAGRKLTWNDFKGEVPRNSTVAALTSTAINIDFGYYNESLRFHIRCRFDKEASWGRIKNDYILSHEQGHFDIAEIYARKLNAALKNYTTTPDRVKKDVNEIYQDLMQQHNDRQDLYDQETNFSKDQKQQQLWLQEIAVELKALQDHANYR